MFSVGFRNPTLELGSHLLSHSYLGPGAVRTYAAGASIFVDLGVFRCGLFLYGVIAKVDFYILSWTFAYLSCLSCLTDDFHYYAYVLGSTVVTTD